jgi:hypothetical protein
MNSRLEALKARLAQGTEVPQDKYLTPTELLAICFRMYLIAPRTFASNNSHNYENKSWCVLLNAWCIQQPQWNNRQLATQKSHTADYSQVALTYEQHKNNIELLVSTARYLNFGEQRLGSSDSTYWRADYMIQLDNLLRIFYNEQQKLSGLNRVLNSEKS